MAGGSSKRSVALKIMPSAPCSTRKLLTSVLICALAGKAATQNKQMASQPCSSQHLKGSNLLAQEGVKESVVITQ